MNLPLATFSRPLTASDSKENIPHKVQVPAGITQLDIRLTFAPWIVDGFKNMLTLSVFDPSGFRGAGHRHGDDHQVVINAARATPGYRAGAIQPGEWTVVVDTHLVMPGAPCEIRLEITGSDLPIQDSPMFWKRGKSLSRGRGWYRGDLHAHTIHSDASWDIPDLLAWARARELDFVTLSDHNTVSGLAQMDAARADDLLTMGGMELTTFWGHALALGRREWIDWRVRDGERTMQQIAAEVTTQGGTFIIAHPMSLGDPFCTGCQWRYEEMMPGTARVVEAWNGPWFNESSNNEEALPLIYRWLNAGHRLALTAGTDNHGRESRESASHGFNVVYAEDLSESEILRAIRAGHTYLSSGPALELNALGGAERAMMGDVLNVARDVPIQLTTRCADCPANTELSLIVDGKPAEMMQVAANGSRSWELARAHWCLLTLRAADETMLALTNPIYFDGRA